MNRFRKISKLSLIAVYLVILAGSIVRMTGSGMGCPDWPKCFGLLIPPTNANQIEWKENKNYNSGMIIKHDDKFIVAKSSFKTNKEFQKSNWQDYTKHNYSDFNPVKTWIEYINRLFGAIAGICTLVMLILSIKLYSQNNILLLISLLIVIGMGFQAWLGKLVVDSNLDAYKITLHMIVALIIVCLIIYLIFITSETNKQNIIKDRLIKNLMYGSILLTLIQIYTGTQVREYIDIQNEILGLENKKLWLNQATFQFYFHRSFSIIIIFLNLILFYYIYKRNLNMKLIKIILILIFSEILIGLIMFYRGFPFSSQPLHLFIATILFSVQFYFLLFFQNYTNYEKRNLSNT